MMSGRAAVIALIEMIGIDPGRGVDPHRIAPQNQPHQIPKMAAFFDKRAAGSGVEAVPVADLSRNGNGARE